MFGEKRIAGLGGQSVERFAAARILAGGALLRPALAADFSGGDWLRFGWGDAGGIGRGSLPFGRGIGLLDAEWLLGCGPAGAARRCRTQHTLGEEQQRRRRKEIF